MNITAIKKRLYKYLEEADDKKVKALYTLVENDIDQMDKWWENEGFIAELDKRSSELKNGNDLGVDWDELKKELLSRTLDEM